MLSHSIPSGLPCSMFPLSFTAKIFTSNVSVTYYTFSIETASDGRATDMNLKGFGKKRPWRNQSTVLEFSGRDRENPRNT
jgi:hypothetical protein